MVWHKVARTDDVGEGQVVAAGAAEVPIALYRIDGIVYATSEICTHAFARLSEGYLDGDCIECPIHQALFHVPTGEVRSPPATQPLRTFAVKIEGNSVLVELGEAQ
jgi:nitrite reductase/ring-hydroxylating ferredoxin subunit